MRKRLAIVLALLLSLLVHLGFLAGDFIPPATLELPDDGKLKPLDVQLKTMSLAASAPSVQPPPAPPPTTLALLPAPHTLPVRPPKPRKSHRATAPKPMPAAKQASASTPLPEASVPASETVAESPSASTPVTEHDTTASATKAQRPAASEPSTAKLSKAQASAAAAEVKAVAEGKSWPGQGVGPDGMLRASQPLAHFPNTARLSYQVFYGRLLLGIGQITWQRGGGNYQLTLKASGLGQRLRYESHGHLDGNSLEPDSYKAFRNDQPREHAEFDWNAGVLHYADGKQEKLEPGAQDLLSQTWQLALKGARLGMTQITTGKKVYSYPLKPAGETVFDTGAGKMRAVVVRATSNENSAEFWLAPGYANLPIRVIWIDPDKKLELRITAININEQDEWTLPTSPTRSSGK
ncbi:DUF3108 domain-containing protein [Crenobacter sp. SG2305]|uniref:DUF3108 domain-containing protein n=1 Tax=Crenobacter oryzisoli TaxID=3056844 RepID=UPI0025AB185E|nr:DUF3108 domain-containing protein [Crenobacter sp. SG2305]MDN0084414.1 DUF3108 domain-containing protein [Crenobacter sp. SG2305]